MVALSIDAGTSVAKCVAFDDDGTELAVGRVETGVTRLSGGRVEQDMEQVWSAVATAVRKAHAEAGGHVRLLSVTGQGDGAWLVDGGGRPTGPAILWNDGRASELVSEWERRGIGMHMFRTTGCAQFPGLAHALLAWLKVHDPERIGASRYVLSCDSWLFSRMTREIVSDLSDASNPFLDARTRAYAIGLLDEIDLSWVEGLLPPLRDDEHRVAALCRPAAEELGLPNDLPVVLAPYDVVASGLGAGMSMEGLASAILGTTLCISAIVAEADLDGPPVGLNLSGGVGDRWTRSLPTLSGVDVLRWCSELLGLKGAEGMTAVATTAEPGAAGLVFLPHLAAAGERAPFIDADATGLISGLGFSHDRKDIARAVLEGLTVALADCVALLAEPPTRLVAAGGGARSDLWCQMLADMTGIAVARTNCEELGALGALMTALVALGEHCDVAEASARYVRFDRVFNVDPRAIETYAELRQRHAAVRAAAREGRWWRLRLAGPQ